MDDGTQGQEQNHKWSSRVLSVEVERLVSEKRYMLEDYNRTAASKKKKKPGLFDTLELPGENFESSGN